MCVIVKFIAVIVVVTTYFSKKFSYHFGFFFPFNFTQEQHVYLINQLLLKLFFLKKKNYIYTCGWEILHSSCYFISFFFFLYNANQAESFEDFSAKINNIIEVDDALILTFFFFSFTNDS